MSNIFRPPRVIRLLHKFGAAAFKPTLVQGRFQGPLISKRKAADLRKRAIVEGTFGSFNPIDGGWDPAWDEPSKVRIIKPFKGHIRERSRPIRAEKIRKAMESMPDRLIQYKKDADARKPKKGLTHTLKRMELMLEKQINKKQR